MQVKGKIKQIYDTEIVSDNFKKRSFVITKDYDAEFPSDIALELHNDKVALLDDLEKDDLIQVDFSISAKFVENKGTYFNNVKAWKIEVIEKAEIPF